jgi:hypothetical protein
VAGRLPAGALLDLGAGAGTYSRAYLARHRGARATLVDHRHILALADDLGPRATPIAGDLLALPLAEHDVVLLANLLHLYPAERCVDITRRAAAALRPGGTAAVVDVAVDADRAGPLDALLFGLDMAVYGDGAVYPAAELAGFLTAADLAAPSVTPLVDGMVLVTAHKTG